MATFSLALPLRFTGAWPNAHLLHAGIFLGAELIVVGDAVRVSPAALMPRGGVLVVSAVVLTLEGLGRDLPPFRRVTGDKCRGIGVRVQGRLYASASEEGGDGSACLDGDEWPPAMRDGGEGERWRRVGQEGVFYAVPLSLVQGRLYEAEAMRRYRIVGGMGAVGCVDAVRVEARGPDGRVKGARWFWAGDRVEALGLETFGGVDVGEEMEEVEASL